jgi:hypothetical protein
MSFCVRTWTIGLLSLLVLGGPAKSLAQSDEGTFSIYLDDAGGNNVEHDPPVLSFSAFLNGDRRRVVTDESPGQSFSGADGLVGINVGIFPSYAQDEDTVYVRFADNDLGQQTTFQAPAGALSHPPPPTVQLQEADLPRRPRVQLDANETGRVALSWEAQAGMTYQVYRSPITDTLQNGKTRKVYQRVAKGLTQESYVKDAAGEDSTFAYIVYAKDDGVWSAHSREVVEPAGFIPDAQVRAKGATNVTLDWSAFPDARMPIGKLAGYSIYRRAEGQSSYGEPVGFTGLMDDENGTVYTDTRLDPGTTYYYQIKARNGRQNTYGRSGEIAVTTEASTEGTYTYANLKVAVAIYQDTNEPSADADPQPEQIPDREVEDIKEMLQYVKEFYWRNSKMKLNLEYTFYVFEEHKEFTKGGTANQTAVHLAEDFGVVNTQYDMIFRVGPAIQGFWSIGARQFDLPQLTGGAKRRTGFAQVHWPKKGGYGYPFTFEDIGTQPALIWTGEHEMQHVIDAVYRWNGHEEMGHGDRPHVYTVLDHYPESFGKRFGTNWNFQASMFRDFSRPVNGGVNAFEDLDPDWGEIYEAPDQDGDDFPDDNSLLAFDEDRFGSSPTEADTDGDGYSDRQEAISGIFHYSHSDPRDTDTDGDGKTDGEDEFPRYPGDFSVTKTENFTPNVDGKLSEWPSEALVTSSASYARPQFVSGGNFSPKVYMAYGADNLYVAAQMDQYVGAPFFRFDFDADGRWFGAGNTQLKVDVSNRRFDVFRSWDARQKVRDEGGKGMWDDTGKYRQQFGSPIFSRSDIFMVTKESQGGKIRIEMVIPKNEKAGLRVHSGKDIGFALDYTAPNANRPRATNTRATTYDKDSFVYLTLGDEGVPAEEPPKKPLATTLKKSYPNPFRSATTVEYVLAENGPVRLTVYDLMGRRVKTLVSERQAAGRHAVRWKGTNAGGAPVASGVYLYRLETPGDKRLTRTVTLVR